MVTKEQIQKLNEDFQPNVEFELNEKLYDIFAKIIDVSPFKSNQFYKKITASYFDTKLGPMIALSDDSSLHLLDFIDRKFLLDKISKLKSKIKAVIIPGVTKHAKSIETQIQSYFEGNLQAFNTPLHIVGTDFQKLVWQALTKIPYGHTHTYATQAQFIGKEKAFRAVANANGANNFAIIIPCHRVISSSGNLGGYSSGIERKEWLLNHEQIYQT